MVKHKDIWPNQKIYRVRRTWGSRWCCRRFLPRRPTAWCLPSPRCPTEGWGSYQSDPEEPLEPVSPSGCLWMKGSTRYLHKHTGSRCQGYCWSLKCSWAHVTELCCLVTFFFSFDRRWNWVQLKIPPGAFILKSRRSSKPGG